MKGLFIRWITSAVALYVTARLAEALGIGIHLTGAMPVIIAVVMLAIVNALIRPFVMLLTIPLSCVTLGLFTFVVNALMFWLVGSGWLAGFKVDNFIAALFGSVVMGIIVGLVSHLTGTKE